MCQRLADNQRLPGDAQAGQSDELDASSDDFDSSDDSDDSIERQVYVKKKKIRLRGQARNEALAYKGEVQGTPCVRDLVKRGRRWLPSFVEFLSDGTRVYHETAHCQADSIEQQLVAPSMLEQSRTRQYFRH